MPNIYHAKKIVVLSTLNKVEVELSLFALWVSSFMDSCQDSTQVIEVVNWSVDKLTQAHGTT